MIVVGKLTGIQDFLFNVAEQGGAQAKRLRARSFWMQILTETLALRTASELGIGLRDGLIFSSAGKFLIESAGTLDEDTISGLQLTVNRELLEQTTGRLAFCIITADVNPTSLERDYFRAMIRLNVAKKRRMLCAISSDGKWNSSEFLLATLKQPCQLCSQENAVVNEIDEDDPSLVRLICRTCQSTRQIGKQLTQHEQKWVILSPSLVPGQFPVGGWSFRFSGTQNRTRSEFALNLDGTKVPEMADDNQILSRQLVRSIPKRNRKPVEFGELASRAKGDSLLGLLKMDADSLGEHINSLNQTATSLMPLRNFSAKLDHFFATTLSSKLEYPEWQNLYVVFAGGDDLMLVGPWNVVFDFAREIQRSFQNRFQGEGLTISGGLVLFKPKLPIRHVAVQAEDLLLAAKANIIEGKNRDQFNAFGQIWKWKDHDIITQQAKQIVEWVEREKFKRGWLQMLLRLVNLRNCEENFTDRHTATSKLAYQVARNFPMVRHGKNVETDIRLWANKLIADFDEQKHSETKYLGAVLRYALTATRAKSKEEVR